MNPNIQITVHDTMNKSQLEPMKTYLVSKWCDCERPEFLCYADDNVCPCGVAKHHVHCKNCGGISQVG